MHPAGTSASASLPETDSAETCGRRADKYAPTNPPPHLFYDLLIGVFILFNSPFLFIKVVAGIHLF